MPIGDDELEIRRDDLKLEITDLTKTHEKQVFLFFSFNIKYSN
jgi:hypothetical protein